MNTATQDAGTKIARNAEIAAKSWHTYVTGAISVGAGLLLWLGKDWVIAFIAQYPALAPLTPLVGLLFVLATQVAPQNIVLSSDKQRALDAAKAWVLELAEKAMPGQPLAIPPEVAKAIGMEAPVVQAAPAEMAANIAQTQASEARLAAERATAPSQSAVVTSQLAATLGDPWPSLRQQNPGKTDPEILALVWSTSTTKQPAQAAVGAP